MELTVGQIAAFLEGEIIGNADDILSDFSKIEEGKKGSLSFLSNLKYLPYLYDSEATAILVNKDLAIDKPVKATLIKVENAYEALAKLTDLYVSSKPRKTGIENPSYISESATLGKDCYIGAFAYIGQNVKIGNNVLIYPHTYIGDHSAIADNTILYSGVKIYEDTQIGANCILHSGVVIGADGFGFAKQSNNIYKKIHQLGNVIIEDDVEIGANSTVDCATMGSTIVKKGVKIDDHVMIAHNVVIGKNTVMAAFTGISGSTTVGENCIFGGQAAATGHIKIGNNVTVGGKTAILSDTGDNKILMGEWGMDASRYKRVYAVFKNLPELYFDVNKIKKEIRNNK